MTNIDFEMAACGLIKEIRTLESCPDISPSIRATLIEGYVKLKDLVERLDGTESTSI